MSDNNKYNIVNYKWDILPYFRVEETSEWIYTFIAVELTKDWSIEHNRFSHWNKLDLAEHFDDVYEFVVTKASHELFKSVDKNKCFIDMNTKDEVNNKMREMILEKFSSSYIQNSFEWLSSDWIDLSEDISETENWTFIDISNEWEIDEKFNKVVRHTVDNIVRNEIFTNSIYQQLNAQIPVFDHRFNFWKIKLENKETWEIKESNVELHLISARYTGYKEEEIWTLILWCYMTDSENIFSDEVYTEKRSWFKYVEWWTSWARFKEMLEISKEFDNISIKKFIEIVKNLDWWKSNISISIDLELAKQKVESIVNTQMSNNEFDKKEIEKMKESQVIEKEQTTEKKWFFWKVLGFFWK